MSIDKGWKVGELAKQTGLTVRTLHYYDQIGLLIPSQHTESGHRLYSAADLRRLLQVISLKQMGFPLDEIQSILSKPDHDPSQLLSAQLERLDEQIHTLAALRQTIADLQPLIQTEREVSQELFLSIIHMSQLMKSPYFHSDQLRKLRNQYLSNNEPSSAQQLLDHFRRLQEKGTPSRDPEVLMLAQMWKKEMQKHALTDPSLIESAERYYRDHPRTASYFGMDEGLYRYIKEAVALID